MADDVKPPAPEIGSASLSQQSSTFHACLNDTRCTIQHLLTVLEQRHHEELAVFKDVCAGSASKTPSSSVSVDANLDEVELVGWSASAEELVSVAQEEPFPLTSLEEPVPSEHILVPSCANEGPFEYDSLSDTDRMDQRTSRHYGIVSHGESFFSSLGAKLKKGASTRSLQSQSSNSSWRTRSKSFNGVSTALNYLSGVVRAERSTEKTFQTSLSNSNSSWDMIMTKMNQATTGPFCLLEEWGGILTQLMEDAPNENFRNIRSSTMSLDSGASIESAERSRHFCCNSIIVRPTSWKRVSWDMFSIFVVLHDIALLPLMVYEFEETHIDSTMFWFTLIFWTQDIMFSFCTGFQVEGTLEMRAKPIAYRYLRGWFVIDILCVAPDWIIFFVSGGRASQQITRLGKAAKVIRLLRGLRLLRVFRLLRAWNGLHEGLTNQYMISIMEFAKFVIVLLFMSHYSACVWYGMSKLKGDDGWVHEFDLHSADKLYMYLTSLHWAMTQLHGSTEITPGTDLERAYAIFYVFVGLIAASVFVSSITNLLLRLQRLHQETFLKTNKLLRYLEQNHISSDLTSRIQSFARHATEMSSMRVNDVELLKSLPGNLLKELEQEIKQQAVSASYPVEKVMRLSPEGRKRAFLDVLTLQTVSPGRLLFQKSESSGKMFILWKGKVIYRRCFGDPSRQSELSMSNTRTTESDDFEPMSSANHHQSVGLVSRSSAGILPFGQAKSMMHLGKLIGAEAPDGNTESVHGCRCIAEANLWTEWQHIGDCFISGHPTIFAVEVKQFGDMLKANLHPDSNLSIAWFISNYAAHYIEWLRNVLYSMDDLSVCPHNRWRRLLAADQIV